jgi:hypothetical protein
MEDQNQEIKVNSPELQKGPSAPLNEKVMGFQDWGPTDDIVRDAEALAQFIEKADRPVDHIPKDFLLSDGLRTCQIII